MRLPRYLQVALVATVGAVVWSQFADDDSAPVAASAPQQTRTRAAKPIDVQQPLSRPSRTNLFPQPQTHPREQDILTPSVKPEPTTPELPLHAMGAWWNQHQRTVLLTDGVETWPVCQRCRADGKIWIGSEPVSGWILKAVEQDHLLFEWQLTHVQRRLALGDLQSEPTR
uniref:hypothetical protein n=1 Tax=Scandinavium goeteborgense TaxID=1851514 RepID=UPI00135CDD4B|nr:hypothetical protein [Scandinavium goeteborgense]